MPRGGPPTYTYSLPAVYLAVPGQTILAVQHNSPLEDIASVLNDPWPTNLGGTGGTSIITSWDSLNSRGANIPTASTVDLDAATGANLHFTGTTTITAVSLSNGHVRQVIADGAFSLTASVTLVVNGSSSGSYAVSAGALLLFVGGSAGVVYVNVTVPVSAATTTTPGIVELATAAETLAPPVGSTLVPTIDNLYFPTGFLYGLTLTNAAGDATNDITIATGTARDSTDSYNMILASALTKQIDAAWAVGNNAGGLATGVAVTNTTYYIFLIKRNDTGVVDAAFDTSSTGANIAANTNAAYTILLSLGQVTRAGGVNGKPVWYGPRVGPTLATDTLGIITPWVAYTPTFTGFGTVSSIVFYSRRVGSNLEIQGRATIGTVTSTEARVSIGFNGVDGNVVTDPTVVPSTRVCGEWTSGAVMTAAFGTPVLCDANQAYVNFGAANSSNAGLTKITAMAGYINNSSAFAFEASVPIAGW